METMYLAEKEGKVHASGRKAGFVIGAVIFSSILFLILGRLGRLPDYIEYWHFAGAAVLLSILILGVSGLRNG